MCINFSSYEAGIISTLCQSIDLIIYFYVNLIVFFTGKLSFEIFDAVGLSIECKDDHGLLTTLIERGEGDDDDDDDDDENNDGDMEDDDEDDSDEDGDDGDVDEDDDDDADGKIPNVVIPNVVRRCHFCGCKMEIP